MDMLRDGRVVRWRPPGSPLTPETPAGNVLKSRRTGPGIALNPKSVEGLQSDAGHQPALADKATPRGGGHFCGRRC